MKGRCKIKKRIEDGERGKRKKIKRRNGWKMMVERDIEKEEDWKRDIGGSCNLGNKNERKVIF